MNRRKFIKAGATLAIATALPAIPTEEIVFELKEFTGTFDISSPRGKYAFMRAVEHMERARFERFVKHMNCDLLEEARSPL